MSQEGREDDAAGSRGANGSDERRVRKLLRRIKKQGDAVVVHRLRGRASNRRRPAKTQKQALVILSKPDWHAFGSTFAAEQLAKHHQIQVGKERLRGWMIRAGGYIRTRLAGRSQAGASSGADDRRRCELELGPLCGARCHPVQHGGIVGITRKERTDGGRLHGPRFDVYRAAAERGKGTGTAGCGSSDPTRSHAGTWALAPFWRIRHRPKSAPGSSQRIAGKRVLAGME